MLSKLSAKAKNTEGSAIPLEIVLYILLYIYFVWLAGLFCWKVLVENVWLWIGKCVKLHHF